MTRYLITNADDFGLTLGVSRGIIRAHREGILTSTSFMTNFPWAGEMAPLLAEAPDLGVGVHLNLTTGEPVLPAAEVRSLVGPDGRFSRSLLRVLTRVRIEEASREWTAQIEKGIHLLGKTPTHLDTHRYLQIYPPLCAVMLELAQRYGISAVRYLQPDFVPKGAFRPWSPAGYLVDRGLRRTAGLIKSSGLHSPDLAMAGDFDTQELLARLGRVGKGVTEVIAHPGEVDDQLSDLSSLREQRMSELAALVAPEVRRLIEERGIYLIHFGHVPSLGR